MKKSTRNIYFSTLLILSLASGQLIAQSDTTVKKSYPNKIGGFRISVGFGYNEFVGNGLGVLNNHLQNNGLAPMAGQYASWNLDLVHFIYRSTVFNLGIGGPVTRNTINDSSKTALSGFTFNLAVGRIIYHSRKVLLYPMLGIDFDELDVDSYYSGFKTSKDVSGTNDYSCANISLTLDYFLGKIGNNIDWKNSMSFPCSCIISFTAGYLYCPATTYWNDNNFDAYRTTQQGVNYPVNVIGSFTTSNLSMLYASVKFGFGIHHTCEKI